MELWKHADLCAIAVKWLQRPHSGGGPGCLIAVSEVAGGWTGEVPDAIGFCLSWGLTGATVIEVKVSRSDFLADKKKPHRQEGKGMGTWRYYMAPEGLIRVDELPDGWGLIEVNKRGHCKVLAGAMHDVKNLGYDAMHAQAANWRRPNDAEREQWMLVKLLARLGDPEKLNRERRDQFANQAILARRIDELREEAMASRQDWNKMYRELELYKHRFGELSDEQQAEIAEERTQTVLARIRKPQAPESLELSRVTSQPVTRDMPVQLDAHKQVAMDI